VLIKITPVNFPSVASGLNQYFIYFSAAAKFPWGLLFVFFNQAAAEVINLYEQTLLGALSDTLKLADNITLLLTF